MEETMQSRIGALTLLGMLLLVMIALRAVAAEENSAVGTWKLNLRRSTFTNMPVPMAEMLMVSTDTETALKWSLTEAAADGKSYHQSFDGAIDGKYHTMTGSRMGSTIAFTRNPPRRAQLGRER